MRQFCPWSMLAGMVRSGYFERTRRLVVAAILYVVRTGCQWRMLPHDFPPWKTVYQIFYRWRKTNLWEQVHDALRKKCVARRVKSPPTTAETSRTMHSTRSLRVERAALNPALPANFFKLPEIPTSLPRFVIGRNGQLEDSPQHATWFTKAMASTPGKRLRYKDLAAKTDQLAGPQRGMAGC